MPNSPRQRTGLRVKNPPVHDTRDIIERRATGQGNHRPTNHRPTPSSAKAAPPYPESGMGVRGRAIRLVHGPSDSIYKNGAAASRRPGETTGSAPATNRDGGDAGTSEGAMGRGQVPKVPWGTDVRGWKPRQERQLKPPKNPHRRAGLQQQMSGDQTCPQASPPSEGGDGNASLRANGRGVVAAIQISLEDQ